MAVDRFAHIAGWRAGIAAAMAGAFAGFGQAPLDIWLATPLGLSLVLGLTSTADTTRAAAWRGFAGAAGYFVVTLHWIVEPFFVDPVRHGWMAPFALILFAGGMALFWSLAGWVSHRLCAQPLWRVALLAPILTLAEAARGTILTGFPWAMPGHALIGTPWMAFGAYGGGIGLTLLVLVAAVGFAAMALRGRPVLVGAAILALASVPYVLPDRPEPPASAGGPTVRLIQPNAAQHLKWQPDMIPVFWQRGRDLTAAPPFEGGPPPDLVIWPETSLPVLLGRSDAARAQLSAAAGDANVLIGAQRVEDFSVRNSLALVAPDGRLVATYDKHHLVPFGEYLPFQGLMDRLNLTGLAAALPGGYRPGPGPQIVDLGSALGRVFPMICYEAIFPDYIRTLPDRPNWIAHVTNDAWFGTFSGPWQHLELAQLRAVEQGLPVLRAANTGISAVIDGRGRILDALPLGEAGFLDATLPPPLAPTLYARVGDAPIVLLTIILALVFCAMGRRRNAH